MISSFQNECDRFSNFLKTNDFPEQIVWVTPSDVIFTNHRLIYVKIPVSRSNAARAKELFELGIKRELGVLFTTLCETDGVTYCYVWVPPDDLARQRALMSKEIKLSATMRSSRIPAKVVRNRTKWLYLQIRYRPNRALTNLAFSNGE